MIRTGSYAVAGLLTMVTLGCGELPLEPREALAQAAPSAQTAPGAEAATEGLLRFRAELGLTETQASEIQSIQEELRTANAPLLQQLRPADGERRQRPDEAGRAMLEQIRENTRAARDKIRSILTDEQAAKLGELAPARSRPDGRPFDGDRQRPRPGGRGLGSLPGPGHDLLQLGERLSLTEDQISRLTEIRRDLTTENQALLEQLRASGTRPFPRRGNSEENPLLQELRANMEAGFEEMLSVLTDAQRAALDELRQQRPEDRHRRGGPRGG